MDKNFMRNIQKIEEIEKYLKSNLYHYLSLNPNIHEPRSVLFLLNKHSKFFKQIKYFDIIVSSFCEVVFSKIENFPKNIFWDLDHLFFFLCSLKDKNKVQLTAKKIVFLQDRYGLKTYIKFSYFHDFSYGFDWIRWVSSSFDERKHVKLYDLPFLNYLEKRSYEIEQQIGINKDIYPSLQDSEYRNVFDFKRDEKSEILLMKELARNNCIPIKAWSECGSCSNYFMDYAFVRQQYAKNLALLK